MADRQKSARLAGIDEKQASANVGDAVGFLLLDSIDTVLFRPMTIVFCFLALSACEPKHRTDNRESYEPVARGTTHTVDPIPYLDAECQLAQNVSPRCEAIIRELSSMMETYSRDHPDAIRLREAASLACCTTEK